MSLTIVWRVFNTQSYMRFSNTDNTPNLVTLGLWYHRSFRNPVINYDSTWDLTGRNHPRKLTAILGMPDTTGPLKWQRSEKFAIQSWRPTPILHTEMPSFLGKCWRWFLYRTSTIAKNQDLLSLYTNGFMGSKASVISILHTTNDTNIIHCCLPSSRIREPRYIIHMLGSPIRRHPAIFLLHY